MKKNTHEHTDGKQQDAAELHELSVEWWQPADCCINADTTDQYLRVRTQDGGGGAFIVVETSRWALDSDAEIDALAAKLKAVLRLGRGEGGL